MTETNVFLKQFSEKQEGTLTKPKEKEVTAKEKEAVSDIAHRFLQETSIVGLLILYICATTNTYKLPFSLQELSSSLKEVRYDYAYGFLIAIGSTGLVELTVNKDVWNCIEMNDKLRNGLANGLIQSVKESEAQDLKVRVTTEVTRIEDYFGLKNNKFKFIE